MVRKKKYHGGLLAFFCLLLVFLLGNCSFCYALTPSNQMTPAIAETIVEYIVDNNLYSSVNGASVSNMNSYYQLADYQDFADKWNNSNISQYCDYLEQCVFVLNQYGGENYLIVLFDNNTIGNDLDFISINQPYGNTYFNFRYINDNGTNIDGVRFSTVFYIGGTIRNFTQANVTSSNGFDCTLSSVNYYNLDGNFITLKNLFTFNYAGYFYSVNGSRWVRNVSSSVIEYIEPEPEPIPIPDDTGNTGQITNNSGDITGNIDLTGIQNSLGNIDTTTQNIEINTQTIIDQQQLIQEGLTTPPDMSETDISSNDITDALDFNFPTDPYANFWLTLTTGLSGALTGNIRSIDITFRGTTYTISLDTFTLQIPGTLKTILTLLSTTFVFWILIKWWKIILNKITSGNVDELLSMNEEERHHRFILGGV